MHRARLLIVPLLLLSQLFAQDPALQRGKDETIAKADSIFGQRYTPVAGKTMRLYDPQTETGPPDEVIFWHGSSYVIELVFAADASVARIALHPEALLQSYSRTDVPPRLELSRAEMQRFIAEANVIRPLGEARSITDAPSGCFQSGKNLYCLDQYELAVVSHYHEQLNEQGLPKAALKDIEIMYKQSIVGTVEDARIDGNQRYLKVDGQWYHGQKPGVEIFDKAEIGSLLQLVTYGCTANKKVCIAMPEKSTSTAQRVLSRFTASNPKSTFLPLIRRLKFNVEAQLRSGREMQHLALPNALFPLAESIRGDVDEQVFIGRQ